MAFKRGRTENECERNFDIVNDLALRKPINDYEHSIRDDVRRAYVVQDQRQSLARTVFVGNRALEPTYRTCLTVVVDDVRLLLQQGLAFWGHNEADDSLNKINFLEILDWYSSRNLDVGKQMAIVLRYVNDHGIVMERFIGLVHVVDTTSLALKRGDELFAKYGLSLSKLRGQGYDGASNMRGELNGLKTLILNENPCASLVEKMESYRFVFIAHLMNPVLDLTSVLSQFLQRKDQNIIEVVSLIQNTKARLLALRENGWDELLVGVNNFCAKNGIIILNMEDKVQSRFHLSRANTNDSHFRIDIYYQVINRIGQEMENRFSESTKELLTCIGSRCMEIINSYTCSVGRLKFVTLNLLNECFSWVLIISQLSGWICEMRENEKFVMLQDMGEVARKMVKVGYHTAFPLVYHIIELVLVLPVATSTVERAFFAMKIIKTDLRNKVGDDFLTDCLQRPNDLVDI
ncbi:hypothetical protein QQ045_007435 [Rhodiola kirilowii]